MNKIKIIACDIDGTLLNNQHVISNYTKQVLIEYQKQGAGVILASGRHMSGLIKLGEELCLSDYPLSGYICLNGLEIRDFQGKCIYKEKQLDYQDVIELDKVARQYKQDLILFFDNEIYIVEHGKTKIMEYHFLSSLRHYVNDIKQVPTECFASLKKVAMLKDAPSMTRDLLDIQKSVIGRYELSLVDHDWIEISHIGVNKGEALKRYSEIYNIPIQETIAFGNGENDITMLQTAQYGVAMENSFQSVIDIADDICLDNDHDGIAKMLKEKYIV